MKRDIKRMKKVTKGQKIVTKHEWIVSTLKTMGIGQRHLDILQNSLLVDPNVEHTPYQVIIENFSKEHQVQ
jgi:hypothetical protein